MTRTRLSGLTGVAVFAAALLAGANSARAQVALPPSWQVSVKPDPAATTAGRLSFTEYIWCESTSFTGQEIARLGFVTQSLTATPGALGATIVDCTMFSATWGTVKFTATVDSTSMTGTMTWTRGTTVYTYNFSGVPYTPVAIDS